MNNRDELNTAQLAEQLGAAIAHRCLNGILSADSQAHGHVVLTSALQALCALPKSTFLTLQLDLQLYWSTY